MATNNYSGITLEGHVVRDLEVKTSKTGTHFVSVNLAVNKYIKQQETTMYVNCYVIGDAADRMFKAGVKKGSAIIVTGELTGIVPRSYTNKNGQAVQTVDINVNVWNWQYVSSGSSKSADGSTAPAATTQAPATAPAATAQAPATAPAAAAQAAPVAPAPAPVATSSGSFVELGDDDDLPF